MRGLPVIICGGDDEENPYDTCLTFHNSKWSQTHKLTTKRTHAACVILNDTTLWCMDMSVIRIWIQLNLSISMNQMEYLEKDYQK